MHVAHRQAPDSGGFMSKSYPLYHIQKLSFIFIHVQTLSLYISLRGLRNKARKKKDIE
jgi:hypothetical protein